MIGPFLIKKNAKCSPYDYLSDVANYNMDKTQLVEIKKGQVGTGLLIERDGYLSIEEGKRQQILESMDNGGFHVPNPFVVDAVFQKYGIKNANGRIYPEKVLKKVVNEYQERIKEKRAYGECYRPEAMILTEDGWKHLADVKEGDMIQTLNTETKEVELNPIIKKIEYDYVGNLVHLLGDSIDDTVTPDHQFPLFDNDENFVGFVKAEDIRDCKIKNTDNLYIPNSTINGIKLSEIKAEPFHYSGQVMCVEVENHTWYVMENGFSHWTKNCNHPSESTIDLGRISHNITELHWEGKTLVGKMELNITEGYRRHGIVSSYGDTIANLLLNGYKIGVSSRGVGSVEQKMGEYIVGDDFELICWDCVSDPSTNNAYISINGEKGLEQYIENNEKVVSPDKTKLNEKLEKVWSLLNE